MQNGPNGWFRKLLTLILVGVWAILSLGLVQKPSTLIMTGLTAFVFLLVGRLWGVEAEHWLGVLNPVTINFGNDNNED